MAELFEKVNICGIPHKVIYKEDAFDSDTLHMGEINFAKAEIYVNKDMSDSMIQQTVIHEMVHGILIHIGRNDLYADETLVQMLAMALNLGFNIRELEVRDAIL